MDENGNRIASTLRMAAGKAPDATSVIAAVLARDNGAGHHSARRLLPLLAAALVATTVVSISAVTQRHHVQRTAGLVSQAVSTHGAQIDVPVDWSLNGYDCNRRPNATVMLDQYTGPQCNFTDASLPPDTSRDYAYMLVLTGPNENDAHTLSNAAQQATTANGSPARTGRATLTGPRAGTYQVLVLDDANVVIAVSSGNQMLAKAILGSARVVVEDPNGCPSHVSTTRPTSADGPKTRLFDAQPSKIVICRYRDGWQVQSAVLASDAAVSLTTTFQRLQPGSDHEPSYDTTDASRCSSEEKRALIVHLFYPNGSNSTVWVHLSGCGAISATNGAYSAEVSDDLANQLIKQVGYDVGFVPTSELVKVTQ